MRALRRRLDGADDFPEQLEELRFFLREPIEGQRVRAVPGAGLKIPVWLLGSSDFSARLAGELGLPFAFAGHFSPEYILPALEIYRKAFKPSDELQNPLAMLAINIIAAETYEEAWFLASSQFQSFLRLIRGMPGQLQPPVENMDELWTPQEKMLVESRLGGSVIGSRTTVEADLERLLEAAKADELIINAMIFDHQKRLRSYEIVADIWKNKAAAAAVCNRQNR
jgi:luciferase family oxidoreductase group 1